ncbi:MAG: hypothetical protein CM15mP111_1690 [Hyphomicrobiales bacterium]|nr:MAG: hypothetical protein CM15mP111_1690 [Hyphomicrobiales bacterium]
MLYDNVPGEFINVNKPDILIIEGLNVLPNRPATKRWQRHSYVSDFFYFLIFVDADEKNIKIGTFRDFLKMKSTAFREEKSYFNKYSYLSDEEAVNVATSLWEKINYVNLIEKILPTRQRANLILRKSENHSVNQISLRNYKIYLWILFLSLCNQKVLIYRHFLKIF